MDAVSPYGYSGAYAHPDLSVSEVTSLWDRTLEVLREEGVISLFLRRSPLVNQAPLPALSVLVVEAHPTYFIDTDDVDTLWKRMEGRARTAIRKANRTGMSVDIRSVSLEDLQAGSAFRTIYAQTMAKVNARRYYLFDDEYYRILHEKLESSLLIATVRSGEGEIQAASLFMAHHGVLHYHLSGSSRDGTRAGATSLLLWKLLEHAAHTGARGVFLGGGVQPGDGLERFKRGFGGDQRNYTAAGVIVDDAAYENAVAASARRQGVTVSQLQDLRFFPAYRKEVK
ncbi:GNAT family N-acetyltransferase [Rhodococcus rhodochrous]|uniref:GNAT family N-acetyltransferase n=1 Tax=Rhodococcus rhodochrous TaxID=1829 RepID=UPI001783D92F|nr:GNAT family N-acetyltransferase [Rhodococcus rhodochrous]